MGERESSETELALLRQKVDAVHFQLETNNSKLQQVIDSVHRIEIDNKSLYMTDKHHAIRLDEIDVHLRQHVKRLENLEIADSQLQGGLSVAKWAFGLVSAAIWGIVSFLIVEAYQEIKATHDIAIINQRDITRFAQFPEDKRK